MTVTLIVLACLCAAQFVGIWWLWWRFADAVVMCKAMSMKLEHKELEEDLAALSQLIKMPGSVHDDSDLIDEDPTDDQDVDVRFESGYVDLNWPDGSGLWVPIPLDVARAQVYMADRVADQDAVYRLKQRAEELYAKSFEIDHANEYERDRLSHIAEGIEEAIQELGPLSVTEDDSDLIDEDPHPPIACIPQPNDHVRINTGDRWDKMRTREAWAYYRAMGGDRHNGDEEG